MSRPPFSDHRVKPDAQSMKDVLGKTFEFYQELAVLTSKFKSDWTFVKGNGWLLNANKSNRTLFFLIPLSNFFLISLMINAMERKAILQDQELKDFHVDVEDAAKFDQYYTLQFAINGEESYNRFKSLFNLIFHST
jgi:hypothetical protein